MVKNWKSTAFRDGLTKQTDSKMKLSDLLNPDYTHFSTQTSKRIRVNKNNTTVTVTTSYIMIKKYVILEILPCGAYKVREETDRNYFPKDVFTTYFNSAGRELTRNEYKGIKLHNNG